MTVFGSIRNESVIENVKASDYPGTGRKRKERKNQKERKNKVCSSTRNAATKKQNNI